MIYSIKTLTLNKTNKGYIVDGSILTPLTNRMNRQIPIHIRTKHNGSFSTLFGVLFKTIVVLIKYRLKKV